MRGIPEKCVILGTIARLQGLGIAARLCRREFASPPRWTVVAVGHRQADVREHLAHHAAEIMTTTQCVLVELQSRPCAPTPQHQLCEAGVHLLPEEE